MESKKIILFILGLLVTISLIGGFYFSCNNICNDVSSVFYGAFSSTFVVLIIEGISFLRDNEKYGHLDGNWHRTIITNKLDKRQGDTVYEEMIRYMGTVNPNIKLNHLGSGRYEGFAFYEEGEQKINFKLDDISSIIAAGFYQYVKKYPGYTLPPDMGRLEIIMDTINKNRIYIYYSNIMPSGIASGYEIWERGYIDWKVK